MIPRPFSKPSTGPPLSLEDHAANAAKSVDTNLGSLDRAVELGTICKNTKETLRRKWIKAV